MRIWRETFGKAVFVILTTALPGYVVGVAFDSGQVPYWGGIAVAFVTWLVALAYGIQRRRVNGYRQAIVRIQAKEDANVTYVIWPEGKEDETS